MKIMLLWIGLYLFLRAAPTGYTFVSQAIQSTSAAAVVFKVEIRHFGATPNSQGLS